MNQKTALVTVLCIALLGLIFSGVLTYQEIFAKTALSCSAPGKPGTVFGYPACVYGFFMYLSIVVVLLVSLRTKK